MLNCTLYIIIVDISIDIEKKNHIFGDIPGGPVIESSPSSAGLQV